MGAFLWVVWLTSTVAHTAGATRMLATFPADDDGPHAAFVSCQEVAQRLTKASDGAMAFFCRENSP